MYGGLQMYRAYRYIGGCTGAIQKFGAYTGSIQMYGDVQMYRGCTDVWGVQIYGGAQMYRGCTGV